MPIYEYKCPKCGEFEVTQRITEDALKKCPTCKSKVERLLSRTSFVLKGTGWYATDYASKTGGDAAKSDSASSDSSKSDSAKTESSPTAAKPDSSSTSDSSSANGKTSSTAASAASSSGKSRKEKGGASKAAD